MTRKPPVLAAVGGLAFLASVRLAAAHGAGEALESPGDAWWTGSLLAPNAATLPKGHLYIEPYLYDAMPYANFDDGGQAHPAAYQNDFGSTTLINYGLTDRLTVGLIPQFRYDRPSNAPASSGIGVGDLSLQAQYRLTPLDPTSRVPIASVNVQETLPVGRYDRLGRASDGFGTGALATTLSAYFMWYFRLPNGRLLRTSLDLSYAIAGHVSIEGRSVYGTVRGFRGRAGPGNSLYGDLAFEYSLTRSWVFACDFWLAQDGSTRVSGSVIRPNRRTTDFLSASGVGLRLDVAPAMEYSWSSRLGVIFGVRIVAEGRNETGAVTPVAALSYFD